MLLNSLERDNRFAFLAEFDPLVDMCLERLTFMAKKEEAKLLLRLVETILEADQEHECLHSKPLGILDRFLNSNYLDNLEKMQQYPDSSIVKYTLSITTQFFELQNN